MKKICPGCNELRDIEKDFAWKNRAKGIRQRWCKFCQAEANRKHYQNNKQTYINHAHQYYQNNKQAYQQYYQNNKQTYIDRAARNYEDNIQHLYEYLSTHPCVDCGHDDIRVLEFDHIHGRKKRSISRMLSIDCPWSTIQAEINKCEVRCANCHRIKTNERGGLWRSLLDRYTNPSAHKKSQLLLHEYLSTHPCVDCSCNNILVLEFDHVHESKKANVAAMARDERPWSTIQAEINKCEVRCANCHRIKTLDHIGSWRSLYGK